MKSLMTLGIACLVIFHAGCGSSSTEPSVPEVNPSTLSANITGQLEATLNWSKCGDTEFNSYTLYRSQTPGIENSQSEAEVLIVYTDENLIEYVDSAVIGDMLVYYAIKTTDTSNNGVWSNEDSVYISTVQDVDNFAVDPSSHGRDVVLSWDEVETVDGYRIFFRPTEEEQWAEIIETNLTSCLDADAQSAGYYAVKAYRGEATSLNYSNTANTMPNIVNVTYTIYDNYSPPEFNKCFIFGEFEGEEGTYENPDFCQDMYAFDDGKGDYGVYLYSGNYGPFGDGNQCFFQEPVAPGYCESDGSWIGTHYPPAFEDILFVKLPKAHGDYAFVKMYLYVSPYYTERGTMVSFEYEYQPASMGLTLFTTRQR